jgi:outer membrane protein assembly factor BamD (BamD/ComL family)
MRVQHRLLLMGLGLACWVMVSGCASMARRDVLDPVAAARNDRETAAGGSPVAPVNHEESAGSPSWQVEESLDEPEPLGLADFAPSKLGTTVKRLTGRGPNREVARQLYGEGEEIYREALAARSENTPTNANRRFIEASERFAAAAERWPDSALEEDALFRAAESRFFADHYVKSNDYFEQLVKKYPNTRYLDLVGARRFLIAQYWLKLHAAPGPKGWMFNLTDQERPWTDTFGHAVRVYDRMRLDDPTGKLADDATIAAANAYFLRGDYQKADQYYTDLRMHFPSSEHQFMGHFLGIQAKLKGYRGPDFTGDGLEEAEKLIKQARRQFPHEMKQHEDALNRAFREVRYRKAEREWQMARYYEQRKEYGAARLYYDLLIDEYEDTPFADKARRQVEQIVDQPLTPPQRLAWLVKLFPEPGQPRPITARSPSDSTER